ncbi:MAG: hypothetical protein K940chlam2_00152 [Chlamydiae bacterium]|nr:hypothetical protein [Chlamydiota bacterium]
MRWAYPQLATLIGAPFSQKGWIFEEKFDGVRCVAMKKSGKVSLFSRNKKSLNAAFPELVKALERARGSDWMVDGEIVAFDGRATSFSKLQSRLGVKKAPEKAISVYFYLFDCLYWKGEDLRSLSLLSRKLLLKKEFSFSSKVRYTTHIKEKGEAYFKRVAKLGLEGIIAKKADAPYHSKRTRDWLKCKCTVGQELVIGGFTEPKGSRLGFGALLVGTYKKGKLRYAGKVGTGYDRELLRTLSTRLKKIERASSPFEETTGEKGAHFVQPRLVCEVAFTEWTNGGKLRHPRFIGLRKDKKATLVKRER